MGAALSKVVDVDSFHYLAHPDLPTIELHGYLRALICIHCGLKLPRDEFQRSLAALNPTWAAFLAEILESGALDTENPSERRERGLKTNPDGDVDLPDAPYSTFRYPACPHCTANPPATEDGQKGEVRLDEDGAWVPGSTAGVLKPAVIMFGESIRASVKEEVERAIDEASKMLVVGSSLATYSAWRLVKRAKERGMPIGIVNMGGVRGEPSFFTNIRPENEGEQGVRCSDRSEIILPELLNRLKGAPNPFPEYEKPRLPSFGRLE